jgi:hypothetical protein
VSADTVVPGNASGGMDGVALKPLTVAFHEYGFTTRLNAENRFGPWFTLSNEEKQQLGSPMGPRNPQALNRYSYVQNNPVRYTDPSGHKVEGGNAHVGYRTVCANAAGQEGACGGDFKEVKTRDGRAHLMRVHSLDENGNIVVKYVWSDDQQFKDFKDNVDAMDTDVQNAYIAFYTASGAAAAGALGCLPTAGFGCAAGIVGAAAATAVGYAYLASAANRKDEAMREFKKIQDARQGPPSPPRNR